MFRFIAAILVLTGALMSSSAYGQGGATGAISGVVVDTSGGSVADAEVQIIDTRTESPGLMPSLAMVPRERPATGPGSSASSVEARRVIAPVCQCPS